MVTHLFDLNCKGIVVNIQPHSSKAHQDCLVPVEHDVTSLTTV